MSDKKYAVEMPDIVGAGWHHRHTKVCLASDVESMRDQYEEELGRIEARCLSANETTRNRVAENERLRDQRDQMQARIEELERKSDADMERVKACEHIAEGDDGWERLEHICPSTVSVATLRKSFQQLESELVAKQEKVRQLETEISDCKCSPGGCGYWKERCKQLESKLIDQKKSKR